MRCAGISRDVDAKDRRGPRSGSGKSKKKTNNSGFSSPIWPKKPEDFTLRNFEREVIKRHGCSVVLGQMTCRNRSWFHERSLPMPLVVFPADATG